MKSLNLIATGLATTAGALSVQAQKVEQPNIIMIMVDDMGTVVGIDLHIPKAVTRQR